MTSLGTDLNLVTPAVLYDIVQKTGGIYDFNTGFYNVACSTKFTWSVFVGGKELEVCFCKKLIKLLQMYFYNFKCIKYFDFIISIS